jgi:hypothetical protein
MSGKPLEELWDAGVAVCDADAIGMSLNARSPEDEQFCQETLGSINSYLSAFAAPIENENGNFLNGRLVCLSCGTRLSGALGSFIWGCAHGEGSCCQCGWPARAYHNPKDDDGLPVFNRGLEIILQYHPNSLSRMIKMSDTCTLEITKDEWADIRKCESVIVREYEVEETGNRTARAMAWGDHDEMEDQNSSPGLLIVPKGVRVIAQKVIRVSDLLQPEG